MSGVEVQGLTIFLPQLQVTYHHLLTPAQNEVAAYFQTLDLDVHEGLVTKGTQFKLAVAQCDSTLCARLVKASLCPRTTFSQSDPQLHPAQLR